MTWKPHIHKITKKISQIAGVINRLKNTIPKSAIMHIYNSLVLPHLNYGVLAWGKSIHINNITKIQKRIVRMISNANYNAHSEPLFKKLSILKMEDIRKLNELKFFYKCKTNLLPEYFSTFLQSNFMINTRYLTRNRLQLSVPVHRHHFFRTGLRYYIVQTINNCPPSIVNKVTTHSIKSVSLHYKNFLIDSYQISCNIDNCYICGQQ